MTTLFISDLHLDASRPEITALFLDFLQQQARQAQALYILGDLFEAWIGDDDDTDLGQHVSQGLAQLSASGVNISFLHGNRDFLVGQNFATRSNVTILDEKVVIDLYGTATLIMHGDTLCTDDHAYQAVRMQVRNPQWQQQMLSLPLAERRALAQKFRLQSQEAIQGKAEEIMDVNQEQVIKELHTHKVQRLIHGHTHRPGMHDLSANGNPAQRVVLGDWYEQGSVLICRPDVIHLQSLHHDQ